MHSDFIFSYLACRSSNSRSKILDINHLIARFIDSTDELIELQIDRSGIAVSRILDEEYHQESHNRGSCIDYQLPGIGEMKDWPDSSPKNDHQASACKGPLRAEPA